MEEKSNAFLERAPLGRLMASYSAPCIISLLVAALYNIVDQIFIANASYLGSYGNAANTVVFPLTVVALAVAVLIGDGCCAFVSISLGANEPENAHRSIGRAVRSACRWPAAKFLTAMPSRGNGMTRKPPPCAMPSDRHAPPYTPAGTPSACRSMS